MLLRLGSETVVLGFRASSLYTRKPPHPSRALTFNDGVSHEMSGVTLRAQCISDGVSVCSYQNRGGECVSVLKKKKRVFRVRMKSLARKAFLQLSVIFFAFASRYFQSH